MTKKIHQIWLGPHPMPEQHQQWAAAWRRLHPSWEYQLWTDQDAEQFPLYQKLAPLCDNYSAKSDILRWCILHDIGGLYIDTDFQPLKPTDTLWNTSEFVTTSMPPCISSGKKGSATNGILYSEPRSQVMRRIMRSLEHSRFGSRITSLMVANQLLSAALAELPTNAVSILPWQWLYPLAFGETDSKFIKAAFAAHHWEGSWLPDSNRENLGCKPRLTPLAAV